MTAALVRAGARVALLDVNDAWLAHSVAEMQTIGGGDAPYLSVPISPILRWWSRLSAGPSLPSEDCTSW